MGTLYEAGHLLHQAIQQCVAFLCIYLHDEGGGTADIQPILYANSAQYLEPSPLELCVYE